MKNSALEFALGAARRTYPHEFIGLLRKNKKGVVSEILVIPMSIYGHDFSSIDFTMVPALSHFCGSIHSHPNGPARPSPQDLQFFSRTGTIHLILGFPFTGKNARAFNNEGKPIPLRILH